MKRFIPHKALKNLASRLTSRGAIDKQLEVFRLEMILRFVLSLRQKFLNLTYKIARIYQEMFRQFHH